MADQLNSVPQHHFLISVDLGATASIHAITDLRKRSGKASTAAIGGGEVHSSIDQYIALDNKSMSSAKVLSGILVEQGKESIVGPEARIKSASKSAADYRTVAYFEGFKAAITQAIRRDDQPARVAAGSSTAGLVNQYAAGEADIPYIQVPNLISKDHSDVRPVVDVLEEFLRFMKKQWIRIGERQYGVDFEQLLQLGQVKIVCARPGNWTSAEDNLYRRAFQQAGIIPTADSTSVQLISEPEAAAMHILLRSRSSDVKPYLVQGKNVMVCDAGGVTYDVCSFKIDSTDPLKLAPILPATAKVLGGRLLDDLFVDVMRRLAGIESKDSRNPKCLMQVRKEIEDQKLKFDADGSGTSSEMIINVQGLDAYMEEHDGSLPDAIARFNEEERADLKYDARTFDLTFPSAVVRRIFARQIDPMAQATDHWLREAARAGKPISILLVGGGFASCPQLQDKLRQVALKHQCAFAVPPNPERAVLEGAADLGILRNPMQQRSLVTSYIVLYNAPLTSDEQKKIHRFCPPSNLESHGGRQCATDVVRLLASKDQIVQVHEPTYTDDGYTPTSDKTYIAINFLRCNHPLKADDEHPMYLIDRELGPQGMYILQPQPGGGAPRIIRDIVELAPVSIDVSRDKSPPVATRTASISIHMGESEVRAVVTAQVTGDRKEVILTDRMD